MTSHKYIWAVLKPHRANDVAQITMCMGICATSFARRVSRSAHGYSCDVIRATCFKKCPWLFVRRHLRDVVSEDLLAISVSHHLTPQCLEFPETNIHRIGFTLPSRKTKSACILLLMMGFYHFPIELARYTTARDETSLRIQVCFPFGNNRTCGRGNNRMSGHLKAVMVKAKNTLEPPGDSLFFAKSGTRGTGSKNTLTIHSK